MADNTTSALTFDNVLSVGMAAVSSVILFFVLKRLFSERELRQSADSPSSHFRLAEVRSNRAMLYLGGLCAFPFAALFLVLCLKASTLIQATKEVMAAHLESLLNPAIAAKLKAMFVAIPSWMDPLFILACALLLFAPAIRVPFIAFRNAVFEILDLDERVDVVAVACAKFAIAQKGGREAVEASLRQASGAEDAPLPATLMGAPDKVKLAYLLLFFGKERIAEAGVLKGLQDVLAEIGIVWTPVNPPTPPSYGYVFGAMMFYGVLCASYVVFAPFMAPWLQESLMVWLQPLEWPAYHDELGLSLAQRTLSFIVPLAFGMYMLRRRRALSPREDMTPAFLVVASVQVAFAMVVNFAFTVISVAQITTGENDGLLGFGDAKLWGNLLVYSLTPAIALLAWILSGRMGVGRAGTVAIICAAAALAFYGSQFAYEAISTFRGFYWHQMVLGAFITMSYGLAALLAGGVLPLQPVTSVIPTASNHSGARFQYES